MLLRRWLLGSLALTPPLLLVFGATALGAQLPQVRLLPPVTQGPTLPAGSWLLGLPIALHEVVLRVAPGAWVFKGLRRVILLS